MSTDSIHPPSKNLTDRLRSCRRVLGTLERFGGNLTSKLATGFAPWMTGEPGKPFEAILAGLAGRLTAARDHLVDRDRAYRLQVTDGGHLRGLRDRAMSALRSAVKTLKKTFSGVYGAANLTEFGFPREIPRQPATLLEHIDELLETLCDPELVLPRSRLPDFDLDAPHLSRTLTGPLDGLRHALAAVEEKDAEIGVLEASRGRAVRHFNETFVKVAGTLESLFRLADLDDVADEIQPSKRRPGVTLALPDNSPELDPDPPGPQGPS